MACAARGATVTGGVVSAPGAGVGSGVGVVVGVGSGVGVTVGVGSGVGVTVGVGSGVGVTVGVGVGAAATVMLNEAVPVCPALGLPLTPYTLYVYVPGAEGAVRLALMGDEPGPPLRLGSGVAASPLVIQKPVLPLEPRFTATATVYASLGVRLVVLGVAVTAPTGAAE